MPLPTDPASAPADATRALYTQWRPPPALSTLRRPADVPAPADMPIQTAPRFLRLLNQCGGWRLPPGVDETTLNAVARAVLTVPGSFDQQPMFMRRAMHRDSVALMEEHHAAIEAGRRAVMARLGLKKGRVPFAGRRRAKSGAWEWPGSGRGGGEAVDRPMPVSMSAKDKWPLGYLSHPYLDAVGLRPDLTPADIERDADEYVERVMMKARAAGLVPLVLGAGIYHCYAVDLLMVDIDYLGILSDYLKNAAVPAPPFDVVPLWW